jgi:rSAM/selenodomain-associated transferase 1
VKPEAWHVVIFAKAPRLGTVKRRLAADIGAFAAWDCYNTITRGLIERLARERRWRLWLAVTPDDSARGTRFWSRAGHRHSIPRIAQGSGDLGARMGRVLRHLPPGPAVIVGSDIPDIDVAAIRAAFVALRSHDAVFGPAIDGGYWLVGLRRRPWPRRHLPGTLFRDVRWSTEHALADTLAGLPKGTRTALLHELADVDDVVTWRDWRERQSTHAKAERSESGLTRAVKSANDRGDGSPFGDQKGIRCGVKS